MANNIENNIANNIGNNMDNNISNNMDNKNNNNNNNKNQNQNNKKFELLVDYKYICIKKDVFDINMIELNFNNIYFNNQIELIYKSPTIILDGIFLKTPAISGNAITIIYKEKNINNITIKLLLNQKEHHQFIHIMKILDEYLSNSINKYSNKTENELDIAKINDDYIDNINNSSNKLSNLKYEQVIKYNYYNNYNNYNNYNSNNINNFNNISSSSINYENNEDKYHIYLKSYLDKNIINDLEKKFNKKYIFTFNISNIYLSNNSLLPLIKCNRCEIQT